MEATDIYKCIADAQRLRILNLLDMGPLCVCHLQDILDETQVKVSKQLAIMKQLGLIESKREANWMIYSLVRPEHPLLRVNLDHLRHADCEECNQLQQDIQARDAIVREVTTIESIRCC